MKTATIGILGGGQLGRMLALSGYPMAIQFRIYEPSSDACAGVVAEHIVGAYDDWESLRRFAEGLDAITYEFENVPLETARFLEQYAPVFPPSAALEVAQDRIAEKQNFVRLGIPTPDFASVTTPEELGAAVARLGVPSVLKTCRMGYDGKGQSVLKTPDDVQQIAAQLDGTPYILEQFIPFERELSLIAVRGRDGACVFYPLTENHHREGILRLSLCPALNITNELQNEAEAYLRILLDSLDYVGVLSVEFFEKGGRLIANEMAPRVHNSGHWTMDAGCVSQFENHVRAVAGLPLGSTTPRGYAAMVNLIGTLPNIPAVLALDGAALHLYGKDPKPGRKIGHINLCADTSEQRTELLERLNALIAPK
jgi:5-(carboxyamino)imidazole ribonucleotide synthase